MAVASENALRVEVKRRKQRLGAAASRKDRESRDPLQQCHRISLVLHMYRMLVDCLMIHEHDRSTEF